MNALPLLREQIGEARGFLEATMADVNTEQARWKPGGKALPINAQYAHILTNMDIGLHGLLKGSAPLAATSWAGKTGFSELPPFGPGQLWDKWAQETPFDLAALRQYAQAIYAVTDEYLGALTEEGLDHTLDLSGMGLGQRTVAWFLSTGWVTNVNLHCGEISCVKGLQGAQGYPA